VYFALMDSGKFGVERETIHVEDLHRFPVCPLEQVPEDLKSQIHPLSDRLIASGMVSASGIESWATALYRLSAWDRVTVNDSLDVSPPFAQSRARAQTRPKDVELHAFTECLCAVANPFLARRDRRLMATILRNEPQEFWIIIQLDSCTTHDVPFASGCSALEEIIASADSLGASQIVAVRGNSTLVVAIVGEYRYFTSSRARLLAVELVQEHSCTLMGEAE